MLAKLHKILRPFLLRRLKTDVASDLPPKKEMLLYVGMSDVQRNVYKQILSKDMDALNGMHFLALIFSSEDTHTQNMFLGFESRFGWKAGRFFSTLALH